MKNIKISVKNVMIRRKTIRNILTRNTWMTGAK
jgi:hypothetical protein